MTLDNITLPDDLLWSDRYAFHPQKQQIDIALTGTLWVQQQAQLTGRPITLNGTDASGWITKAVADALLTKASETGQMTLTMDGAEHSVVWAAEGFSARPVQDYADPDDDDYFIPTIRLIKVD